jgi:hypothetical protein
MNDDQFAPLAPDTMVYIRRHDPQTTWPALEPHRARFEGALQPFHRWRNTRLNEILCRVEGVAGEDGSMTVVADVTYLDVVAARSGRVSEVPPFQVLSALAVVRTADGVPILMYRNSGDWLESFELPGGFFRARYTHETLNAFIIERIERDCALKPEQIVHSTTLGILEAKSIFERIVVFEILIQPTFSQFVSQCPFLLERVPDGTHTMERANDEAAVTLHPPSARVLLALRSL